MGTTDANKTICLDSVDATGQISGQQSEADFQRRMVEFFDATSDAIIFLDRDYRFRFLNRMAQEVISRGADILGKVLWEAFPDVLTPGAPYLEHYRRSMVDRQPSAFEAFYPQPLNIHFRINTYPADGGIFIFCRDITVERQAEIELRRKTTELNRQFAEIETLYRTAPIGLAFFSVPEYRYMRLNELQASFFGLKPEEIVGKTLTEMAPIPGLKELFDQAARGEPVINHPLEGTLVTDPTDYRYWLVSYFPVYGEEGKVEGITAASLEVTSQRKAEAALLRSEKLAAVGRLASSIAHEINNPLESVTNLIYLAKEADDQKESREFLTAADRELRRVSAIVTQTLRFHKQASSPQEITAGPMIEAVLMFYQARIHNAHVNVSRRISSNQQPVRCFEGEIRQVLSNLVANALDAMQESGGTLYVRGRQGTNWRTGERGLVLTIGDTGCGMSRATQEKIFTAFFTTKGMTGTGLGLWVSQEIVQRHRGCLRVRSRQAPSKSGTVFKLFLPFHAAER